MRTEFKISVIALGLFISELSYAGTHEPFETEVLSNKSFRLEIKQIPGDVQLKLTDESGFVLYKESFEGSSGYHKVFNVSSLPAGDYRLELEYLTSIQILPMKITSGQIVLNNERMIELFKPVVRQEKSTVSVSMLNKQLSPLKIKIYDDLSQLVYNDQLDEGLLLGKQYDLSRMDPGVYSISLTSKERTYLHKVSVE